MCGAKVSTPRFKWGQNKETIFLSVMVRELDRSSVAVSLPDAGAVTFKAQNSKGEEFSLELPLREDVKVDTMKWEHTQRGDKWGDAVLITLGKMNEHRWDVLVTDPKKFKTVMDKDWSREDQTLEPEDELPYVEDNADFVIDATEKKLDAIVKKHSALIVNVRYPWCTQCKSQDETFVKAAKEAKKKGKKKDSA